MSSGGFRAGLLVSSGALPDLVDASAREAGLPDDVGDFGACGERGADRFVALLCCDLQVFFGAPVLG